MNAECRIFAEDILSFVKLYYASPNCLLLSSKYFRRILPLTNYVRSLILYNLQNFKVEVRNIFNSLLEHENLNEHFAEFSKTMAKVVCERGFNEKETIQFCVVLSMLAVFSHSHNFSECIHHALSTITVVITYFKITGQLTEDIWRKLAKPSTVCQ